jgi:uncharacterized membrane protein
MSINRLAWPIAGALTALALAASIAMYPRLPEQIPIHWDLRGRVDDYGAKAWAAFLSPAVMLAMLGLFAALPWLSPRHFEVDRFRSTYLYIMVVTVALFAYLHGLMLYAAMAGPVDVGRALVAGICLLLALLGNVLGKVQRNFYIGVRTPWTLASDRVWADTHRLAAWLFVIAGLLGFALGLAGWLIAAFGLILAAAIISIVYSLVRYKQLDRRGGLE